MKCVCVCCTCKKNELDFFFRKIETNSGTKREDNNFCDI